jgi:hypothetical protein
MNLFNHWKLIVNSEVFWLDRAGEKSFLSSPEVRPQERKEEQIKNRTKKCSQLWLVKPLRYWLHERNYTGVSDSADVSAGRREVFVPLKHLLDDQKVQAFGNCTALHHDKFVCNGSSAVFLWQVGR